MQVSLDVASEMTWERDVRALASAARAQGGAAALLITLDSTPPPRTLPEPLQWLSAVQWLLESDVDAAH